MAPKTLCIQDLIQDTRCSIKEMQAMIIEKFETRANHVRTMTDLQSSPTSTTAAVNDLNFVHPQAVTDHHHDMVKLTSSAGETKLSTHESHEALGLSRQVGSSEDAGQLHASRA